jgi:hypothetical protein
MKQNLYQFPGKIVVDPSVPDNTIYFLNLKYKLVQVEGEYPITLKEVVDWEATAKASVVMFNISTNQGE